MSVSGLGHGQERKVKIVSFGNSSCTTEWYEERKRLVRIADVRREGKNLVITIDTYANCGAKFTPLAKMVGDELWLSWDDTGEQAACSCCFELDYVVRLSDPNVKIKYFGTDIPRSKERYMTYPIKYELKNGDTINYVDKYGRRQGVHFGEDVEIHFLNDMRFKYITYYENGGVESIRSADMEHYTTSDKFQSIGMNRYTEYYANGKKKKECYDPDWWRYVSEESKVCKEWNENGELISK